LFCQQIESSGYFFSYNFSNSLQPGDVVEHIYIYIYMYIGVQLLQDPSSVQVAGPLL
jgi:hypothetical protein